MRSSILIFKSISLLNHLNALSRLAIPGDLSVFSGESRWDAVCATWHVSTCDKYLEQQAKVSQTLFSDDDGEYHAFFVGLATMKLSLNVPRLIAIGRDEMSFGTLH